MSYINEALKKAQREKDSRYGIYRDIILPSPIIRRAKTQRKWLIGMTAFLMILLLSGALVLYYYDNTGKITDTKPQLRPVTPLPSVLQSRPLNQTIVEPVKPVKKEDRVVNAPVKAIELYQEALTKQRKGRFSEAEQLYKEALELNPRNVRVLNNLGVIYMSQKKNNQAINAFGRAIAFKDDYVDPYYNLACLYSQLNNTGTALRYLQRAATINREVIQWAKTDADLVNLQRTPEFKKLLEEQAR